MYSEPRRTLLVLFVLFLAVWTPRVLVLDRFVTEDERRWLTRSANFYQALVHGGWAHTFQREHPSVTVMWMGTFGFLDNFPAYARMAPDQCGWDQEELEGWLRQTSASPSRHLVPSSSSHFSFILLWPAMWVDPLGSLLRMRAEMGEYVEGHVSSLRRPIYNPAVREAPGRHRQRLHGCGSPARA